jgi:hypothetical protein
MQIMKPNLVYLSLALAFVCAPCLAQTTPVKVLPPANTAEGRAVPITEPATDPKVTERGEPNVKHIVIEDDGSKIDELRVRGQTQHVVVTPKVGPKKSYEIIVGRSGREPIDGTGGPQNAVGKRVWSVLDF